MGADSIGKILSTRVLQQIQEKACTRKSIQRIEKTKLRIFANGFFYILRQSLLTNWV